jgi:uncharacterized membrane protein
MAQAITQRLRRVVRHLRSSAADARRAFPPETLSAIGGAIAAGEQTHRGELRLIVEKALPIDAIWAGVTNRERALALFAEYGVWDTQERCGVLIYINLAEHKVDIVADRGIDSKIDSATWLAVCRTMTEGFAHGQFLDSTLGAITQVNQLLHQHFPANGDRPNELPNQPVVL